MHNVLTYTEIFDPERTDWAFGCNNKILPAHPLELRLDPDVPNPDGTTPSHLVVASKAATLPGCVRKSYEPIFEVAGYIETVQTLSIYVRQATAQRVGLAIYNRERQETHGAVFAWKGSAIGLHALDGLSTEELVSIEQAKNGWWRIGVTYFATPKDLGDVKNVIINPSRDSGPVVAGTGTYIAQAQLELGPEMTEYEPVKLLGRFEGLQQGI